MPKAEGGRRYSQFPAAFSMNRCQFETTQRAFIFAEALLSLSPKARKSRIRAYIVIRYGRAAFSAIMAGLVSGFQARCSNTSGVPFLAQEMQVSRRRRYV